MDVVGDSDSPLIHDYYILGGQLAGRGSQICFLAMQFGKVIPNDPKSTIPLNKPVVGNQEE
jgi:hypothetical protein